VKVVFSSFFQAQLFQLQRVDTRHIGIVLDRLKSSDTPVGKRLSGNLHLCFSVRAGLNQRLRLVYLVRGKEARILTVGPREDEAVYIQAQQILKELER
jgi:hypothetical protein